MIVSSDPERAVTVSDKNQWKYEWAANHCFLVIWLLLSLGPNSKALCAQFNLVFSIVFFLILTVAKCMWIQRRVEHVTSQSDHGYI